VHRAALGVGDHRVHRRTVERRLGDRQHAVGGALEVVVVAFGALCVPARDRGCRRRGVDAELLRQILDAVGTFEDAVFDFLQVVLAPLVGFNASVIADVSRGLGEAMVGINVGDLPAPHRLAERGW